MTWSVHVEHDPRVDGIAIMIARRYPDAGMAEVLTLEDDLGRALLDALAEHYGNTSSGRQQRADYEHERARVDRLIGALISTKTPAHPGGATQGVTP